MHLGVGILLFKSLCEASTWDVGRPCNKKPASMSSDLSKRMNQKMKARYQVPAAYHKSSVPALMIQVFKYWTPTAACSNRQHF